MNNKILGNIGEDMAENYLNSISYKVLTRNFSCRIGEIDIIAIDKNTLTFIEVKARRSVRFGQPVEAITLKKKDKLRKTAQYFLAKNTKYKSFSWRIDLIALKLSKERRLEKIFHIKNILNG